jgi:outer membrane protein assembly factor BamB
MRRPIPRAALVCAGLAAIALLTWSAAGVAQTNPQDYPQWRGRNRDGAASAFAAPKTWPDSLTLKWKVDIGPGYSTPIVVGSRVYTFTRRDGNEVMMALDAASGKILWQTAYPAPYKMNPATKSHGEGPKSTPLFYNGKLYTLGISGIVSAFDASTGKVLWQTPAPAVDPLYGTAMSPIADRDAVIVHVGGNSQGALTAFDANTGKPKWVWTGDGPAYGSPVVASIAGTRQVITETQESLVSVDAATGSVLWQRKLISPHTTNAITPIVFGDTIIYSADSAGIIAVQPVKRGAVWSTEDVWDTKDVSLNLSNAVLLGDTVVGLSQRNSGQLFALDARTGKVLWLGKAREATNTALVTAGELVFLLNDDAQLTIARGSRTGLEPLHKYTVADGATWAQPAITGNRVFIKDVSTLALWSFN